MVQVIQSNRQKAPSFLQSVMGGLAEGASQAIPEYLQRQRQENQLAQENEAAKRMGIDLAGFSDPKLRQTVIAQSLQNQGKEKLLGQKQTFLNQLLGGSSDSTNDQSMNSDTSGTASSSKFNPENISDADIIRAEALGIRGVRDAKDAAIKKREGDEKEKRRQFESDRDFHTKKSGPVVEEAQNIIKNYETKRALINQQRRDIASGQTEGMIPFLVDAMNLDVYRNPESARFRTASKERFVESLHDLGGAGARPNQFIEQQLVASQPAVGRSEEANQTVLDLEEFVNDLKFQRAKYISELAEQDNEKYGYERGDIAARADKMMKDYAEQRQDEMAYDIRKRHEDTLDDTQLVNQIVGNRVPQDTPLTLRVARILMIKNNDDEKKATAEAKQLGFKIPSEKTYSRGF